MKPFIVEFSGTLEAGKTTSIRTIANMLRNDGYKVLELQESAELLPKEFKKGTFESNMWMHFITQAGLLKALYSDTDIVLVDRGYFDSKFYGYKFYKEGMCNKEEYDEFNSTFIERLKPDLLIALVVSPQIAVKRRGGKGHLVNCEYINRYNEIFLEFFEKLFCDKELVQTDFMDVYTMNDTIYGIITKRM